MECPACSRAAGEGWKNAAPTGEASGTSRGSLRSALALYFAFLATILGGFLLGYEGATGQLIETAIVSIIVLGWTIVFWREVFPSLRRPPRATWLLAGVGLALPTFAAASLLVDGMTDLLGAEAIEYTPPFLEAGYEPWVIILAICIQPAVFEEIAFRGVILSGLQQSLQRSEALVVSALLFTTIHLSVLSFPHLFLLGLLLGALRLRSGSLYPAMALHFTHNLLCVLSELAAT